jgi:hypothetical protein
MSHSQTLGAGDALGTGDSYLTLNVVPPELADVAFDRLRDEVKWDVMHHRGMVSYWQLAELIGWEQAGKFLDW